MSAVALATLGESAVERVHPTARVVMPTYMGPALEGLRVLVVDDEMDALDLATAILTAARADVRTCQSAAEALAVIREWRPDVLIADIEMPVEDGLSLIRKIRALGPGQGGNVPAIALTAYGRVEDRVRGLQARHNVDAADYLAFVHDLPLKDYLTPNPVQREILASLTSRKLIFTNADVPHARRVLAALSHV